MTKARKPNFEPSTVPIRNGNFSAWLELVFTTAVEAGERQKALGRKNLDSIEAARASISQAVIEAARMAAKRINRGGEGEAA